MKLKTFLMREHGITSAVELATILGMHQEHIRKYWTGMELSPLFAQKLQKKLPVFVSLDDLLKLNR
jgi:hypothetical protein